MDFFGDDETETPGQNTDSVEADVLIDTTIENAWALVSEPGWWINDGPLGDHDVEHGDDGLYHVTDPEAGTCRETRRRSHGCRAIPLVSRGQ